MMRIGLAQIKCSLGNIEQNTSKIAEFAKQAAHAHCDVVIFPEMSDTGYDLRVIRETACTWSDLPFITAQRSASANGIYLICGLSERDGDDIFNSLAIFSPRGELLGMYRKTHLCSPTPIYEDQYIRPGSALTSLKIGGLTWGFSICYDLRFPELFRALALQGAEVLVNCAAWPTLRQTHWDLVSPARAIENQAYFIGVNRVGQDGELTFCGKSRMIAPFGDIVVEASPDAEELVVGEISAERITEFRESVPLLKSRRDDIYGNPKGL